METIQKPSVIEKTQCAAQAYGIKRLAAELNKAPSTVYSELNPWGDRTKAKLGFEDALEIMRITGDYSPLVEACALLGLTVVMADPTPDKGTVMQEMADDIKALADFHKAIADKKSIVEVQTMASGLSNEVLETAVMYASKGLAQ